MRYLRTLSLCGFLIILPEAAASAEPTRGLTEDESVLLALEHNARLQVADAGAAEARALHEEALAARLPEVVAGGSYTRLGGDIPMAEFTFPGLDTPVPIFPVDLNRYHAELSVEQQLYTGGRVTGRIRAAAHEASAAAWLVEQERVDVAFEVRQAYWELYGARAVRDTLEAALAQVEEHLRNVRDRVAAGAALTAELLAAETRRSEVLLDRVEADNAVRLGGLELSRLIGLPLESEIEPIDLVQREPPEADLEMLAASAVAGRPHISALAEQVDARRAQLEAAHGARLPEFGLFGRLIHARPNPHVVSQESQFRTTWEAGLSLRWILWDAGRISAQVAQAAARLSAAEARFRDAREQVVVSVSRSFLEHRRATEAIGVAGDNVRQAEEAFRVVRQQFDEGAALSAQVLDAELAHRTALARRARGLADVAVARAAVLHALGEVW